MKVVFVRHGESNGNAGVPSFDLSKLELTQAGHDQAAAVAASWKDRPDLIVLSPNFSTHLTAQPTIERYLDVPVEVVPMEEFTYLEPSRWNGTSRAERPPHIEAFWETADPACCDGPGAESFDTLLGRVDRTLQRLASLPSTALIYAFSHGQFMQAVWVSLLHPTWTAKQKMAHFWPFNAKFPILNVDQLEVVYEDGVWRCVVWQESGLRSSATARSAAPSRCVWTSSCTRTATKNIRRASWQEWEGKFWWRS